MCSHHYNHEYGRIPTAGQFPANAAREERRVNRKPRKSHDRRRERHGYSHK